MCFIFPRTNKFEGIFGLRGCRNTQNRGFYVFISLLIYKHILLDILYEDSKFDAIKTNKSLKNIYK